MIQLSFADSEFVQKRSITGKELFFVKMEKLVPWRRLIDVIEPHYPSPKRGNGRPPYPLEIMIWIDCLQQWYSLSDDGMEDTLYEIASMRLFAGLLLDRPVFDRTTIMNFRHLIEKHQLGRAILTEINNWLMGSGIILKEGTLVDATIIESPTSTKNKKKQRDPYVLQIQKGNQWYFGMKAHIGVDARTGLTHSLTTTAANEHDRNQAEELLYGYEGFIFSDAGYQGAEQRLELPDVSAKWFIAENPSRIKELKKHLRKNRDALKLEYDKASIRAFVEHPFRIIKCRFGFVKAVYKGLKKKDNKLATLFALANIVRQCQLIRA